MPDIITMSLLQHILCVFCVCAAFLVRFHFFCARQASVRLVYIMNVTQMANCMRIGCERETFSRIRDSQHVVSIKRVSND